jgi:hypothetical protein
MVQQFCDRVKLDFGHNNVLNVGKSQLFRSIANIVCHNVDIEYANVILR